MRAVPRQQQLQPHQRRLLQLPPERLQRHQRNPPHKTAGFPQDCTLCHNTTQLDGRHVQPHHHRLRPHRRARHHAVRAVPRQQQLQPHQRRLHQLPPDRLQRHHQPAPQGRRLPAGLLALPHHHQLDRRHLQPRHHGLRAHRRAHQPAVRAVPRQQQLQPDQRRLHQLPPDRLQRHHQPAAQGRRLPAGLHAVPHHHRLDGRHVQPHHHRLRADRRAHQPAVRAVPRQQQLQPDQRRLHQLPPDRLQQHHQSAAYRLPASRRIAPLCHTTDATGPAPPSTTPPRASPSPARTPRCSARSATSTTTTA